MQGTCNRVYKRACEFVQYTGDNVLEVCDFIKKFYPRMVDDYEVDERGKLFILDEHNDTSLAIELGHLVVSEHSDKDGYCGLDTTSEDKFLQTHVDIAIKPWRVNND